MKRTTKPESTTNPPSPHRFEIGPRGIAVGLASFTALTFPVATVTLHHQNMGLALLVGLIPVLPLLLIAAVFVMAYAAASVLAIVTTARIVRTSTNPAICFDDLSALIVNVPVAFLTLTPLKLAARERKLTSPAPSATPMSPLPAAPARAREEEDPFYWRLVQEKAHQPGGASQIVTPEDVFAGLLPPDQPDSMPGSGRHARPEKVEVPQPEAENRVPAMTG